MNKPNVITRNLTIFLDEEPLNFDEIFSIEDPTVMVKAIEVASLFQNALVPVGDSLKFDVIKANELVKETPGLAVVRYMDQSIETHSQQTSVMVDKVVDIINKVLGITLGPGPTASLSAAIEGAYVGLNEVKDDAWIFWEKKSAHKTTYQYNITFATQNAETGLLLYSLPMGLSINVDKEYERVLFITLTNKETYSCRIQSLSAVCMAKDPVENVKRMEHEKLFNKVVAEGPHEMTRAECGIYDTDAVSV
jgi:hypothetical protein|tara:strand:- start:168 stop:917 length:750 start_codon:yes stop_codon:yes gene_type:complete